jgi:hypothetical protein
VSKLDHMGGPQGRKVHNSKDHTNKAYNGWLCLHVRHTYSGHTFWGVICPVCHAAKVLDVNSRAKWATCKHPEVVDVSSEIKRCAS